MLKVRRWAVAGARILALLAISGGLVYWIRFSPITVSQYRLARGPVVAEVMGTGTLEARLKSTISPRISGRIQEVVVDMGDQVTAGKLLAKLDEVELRPQVEMAAAAVTVAKATLERWQAERTQALANLEQATASHARAEKLLPTRALSQEDADRITAEWKIAQAGVARSEAALLEGQKQLIAAETTLGYRKALLADTEITAPFDGLVVQRHRDPGDIAVPGSAILTLISTDELWITAWVDETEMSRLAVGQGARVVFRSEPARSYRGNVARLGRQADRETREFTIDVRVLELPRNWAVGQRAEVYIEVDRKDNVTVLPAALVLWRDGKPGVFVRHGQSAVWRSLILGLRSREAVEVIDGLKPGDTVVTAAEGKAVSLDRRRIAAP